MAIPILSDIEKLINEHGSATILRERLALARDQYEALEKNNSALMQENAALKEENQRLELDNAKLREKIGDLEKQLPRVHAGDLGDAELEILKLFAKQPTGITSPQITTFLGWNQVRTEHFLNLLREKGFITVILAMGGHARYVLDHKGNEYLVKNNLV